MWLGEIDAKLDKLNKDMSVEIAMLKVKSGLWGAMAGVIPAALILIYQLLR